MIRIPIQYILYYGIAFFLSFSLPAFAEVYLWTDDQGIKHYSNQKPPETIEKYDIKPEVKLDDASVKPPVEQEMEDAELEEQVKIRKEKDELEKSAWIKEKQQKESEQVKKQEKREKAMADARARVQSLEKQLERYEDRQRKHGRKYHYENTIRDVREELHEAKKKLRAMELHGDFSAVE
jgi:DNA repair exonuclease SbcCD ATPase subunit